MPLVQQSILIHGSFADVFAIACDMERYPDFMEDVESVTILDCGVGDDGLPWLKTDWVTSVDGTPILWTEIDVIDETERRIVSKLIEGDMDKFDGQWLFAETPDGIRVTLVVDFDFGIPELMNLIGPTLEIKVRENSAMMLSGMKQRVEAVAVRIESPASQEPDTEPQKEDVA